MKTAIILPAYNESKRIAKVIQDICAERSRFSDLLAVYVVDDGSSDRTQQSAEAVRAECAISGIQLITLRHRINLGKGAAAKTGADAAVLDGAEYLVFMDSDGQHTAQDASTVLDGAKKNNALVVGARKIAGQMPLMMRIGNYGLNTITYILFGLQVRDSQSGLRAMSSDIYRRVRWAATNYAMESEMLVLASLERVTLIECEIATIYHDRHKGTTFVDGFRILQRLLSWRVMGRQIIGDYPQELRAKS